MFSNEQCIENVIGFLKPKHTKIIAAKTDDQKESEAVEIEKNEFTKKELNEFMQEIDAKYAHGERFVISEHEVWVSNENDAILTVAEKNGVHSIHCIRYVNSKGEFHSSYELKTKNDVKVVLKEASKVTSYNEDYLKQLTGGDADYLFPGNIINLESKLRSLEAMSEDFHVVVRFRKWVGDKFAEETELAKDVEVDPSKSYRRINVVGDGSYSEDILSVLRVTDTTVILKKDDGCTNFPISTSRKDFHKNFESAEVLLPEILDFVNTLVKNVVSDDLIKAVKERSLLTNRENFQYTSFNVTQCVNTDLVFETKSVYFRCSDFMDDNVHMFVHLKREHLGDKKETETVAQGFVTDVFLAYYDSEFKMEQEVFEKTTGYAAEFLRVLRVSLDKFLACEALSVVIDGIIDNAIGKLEFLRLKILKEMEEEAQKSGESQEPKETIGSALSTMDFFKL